MERWASMTAPSIRRSNGWKRAVGSSAEWGVSDTNRRARYYKLTAAGRQRLRTESETWLRYTKSVTGILALAARNA